MTGFFGPDLEEAGAWGGEEADAPEVGWGEAGPTGIEEELPSEEDDRLGAPSSIDLGGGFKLMINPDVFRMVMHTPEITAQVAYRCKLLADTATSIAITPGAEYTYVVSDNPENIRARGRVKPGNYKAVIDDLYHDTLLRALAIVGSDPKPTEADAADRVARILEGDSDLDQIINEGREAMVGHMLSDYTGP